MNLGRKLFRAVERNQGYAFISDAVEDMTDDEVLEIARRSLEFEKKCVTILEQFLERYDK